MLNLKFEQVRAFLYAARGGANAKAANALNLTQPAITARIKNLEKVLGVELFNREDGARRLSKHGQRLLDHAIKLEHLIGQIERDVANPAATGGHLRLGLAESIAQSWMSAMILDLHASLPGLDIELQVDISPRIHEALCNRQIDLAIALGTSPDPQVSSLPLPPIPLNWYCAATDPAEDPEAARRLFGKPVITCARNTLPYRQMRDDVWTRVGRDVSLFPSSSLPSAARMVAAGIGVAALPSILVEAEERAGTIRRFDPQWQPAPLCFSVNYIADPADPVVEQAARIAMRNAPVQA